MFCRFKFHFFINRCNPGFIGETCYPEVQMDQSIQADFGLRNDISEDFTIKGGETVRAGEGCGIILSGENMYFSGVKYC